MRVDTFGRKFQPLIPRSPLVCAKVLSDWRLRNAMSVLTEVGPDNGGRLLSIKSSFEIRNNTTHAVKLIFHPDPSHNPDLGSQNTKGDNLYGRIDKMDDQKSQHERALIHPNRCFQLPTLLLESALEMAGSKSIHLGSFWIWYFFACCIRNEPFLVCEKNHFVESI